MNGKHYPPISPLPSLSRLMKDGIGEGMTREDHKDVASQLFAAYSKVKSIRNMASIVGEEEMSEIDKKYLKFGSLFEKFFLLHWLQGLTPSLRGLKSSQPIQSKDLRQKALPFPYLRAPFRRPSYK